MSLQKLKNNNFLLQPHRFPNEKEREQPCDEVMNPQRDRPFCRAQPSSQYIEDMQKSTK